MLRLCPLAVVLTILLAGGVSSDASIDTPRAEGGHFLAFVMPNHVVKTCILKPPHDENFKFTPRDTSSSTEKYDVLTAMDCMLNINKLDSNDEGIWVMTYDHEHATTRSYNVTVNVAETIESEEEDEDAGITLLSTIRHSTRIGLVIDITLDKQSYQEECYVQPPNGVLTHISTFRMNNVVVQRSSNFVSCRITIGPMSESLLGEWRLCGSSTSHEMRCQPANIVWNNNNPTANWGVATQNMFSHPVHFGGSVNPGVVGTGNAESCHVITPNGEDLVITTDVKYPHIERIALNPTLCSINFTNIDSSSIGDWTIYGKFRALTIGLNEVYLPLRFFLYNEDHPYEQAYNVTTLQEDRYLVILGRTLEVSVRSVGQVDNCQYRMPTGQSYDLNNAVAALNGVVLNSVVLTTACQITFSPINKDMLGEWQLIGKFSNGNQFTERRQTFHIIEEDPANPILDDFRVVENLTETIFTTELEATHRVTIASSSSIENESCHLLTPNGLQYAFIDGFNVPNVEIIEGNGIECGVQINVESLDMLGQWTLIARATRSSTRTHIERRRKFTIRIEETSSLGNPITITEGADLYVSLPNATHMYDTCKLYGPNDEPVKEFEVDQFRFSSCGFTVRNVTSAHRGIWAIVYGNTITYKATVQVNILELVEISVGNWTWTEGNSVNVTLGPEDAVFCRLFDSEQNHIFDGFGACRILLDRVTMALKGWWSIEVGVPGTVMLRRANFYVNVIPTDNRPVVTTEVAWNGSSVLMTCSVPAENDIEACLFRDPIGNILIASHGVGQDGYTGVGLRYESDSESHDCALRLLTPSSEHNGIWRCAVDTTDGTSYGFLNFSMDGINYNNNIERQLVPSSHSYWGTEGKAETMSCSIGAAIRYCYFRAPNGTIFNVGPSISSEDYEYVGNSLDAGECGIRFNNLWLNDSGVWSCNVGLVGEPEERRSSFDVNIYERIKIYHGWQGSTVSLRLAIGDAPRLEYCRFVRIDGLAFMSDNVPFEYQLDSYEMSFGACALTIYNPESDDMRPWTVFAKAVGTDGEMSMTSTFNRPPPQYVVGPSSIWGILLWTFFVILGIVLILVAVSLIPKKNREWTYRRASSIRNSLRKQPLPVQTDTTMIY